MEENQLPHLLLYGPPGTGKTSTILALARQMYGKNAGSMVLELNASDDRGIDIVRNEVQEFAGTRSIFSNKFKLIILDECDAMTRDAQMALRRGAAPGMREMLGGVPVDRCAPPSGHTMAALLPQSQRSFPNSSPLIYQMDAVMEKYVRNARFCLICNYVSKIIPALQSRCTRFRFQPLPPSFVTGRVQQICDSEGWVGGMAGRRRGGLTCLVGNWVQRVAPK